MWMRDAGRHELDLAGCQRQRRVDARAQIESGGSRRGILRQARAHALVQHLERDARRFASSFPSAACLRVRQGGDGDFRDQPARQRELVHPRQRVRAPLVEQRHLVLSLPIASCARLAISSGTFLRGAWPRRCCTTSSVSAAKPTQNGGFGRAAMAARMSDVGLSASVSGFPFFLSLLGLDLGRRVIGDRGNRDEDLRGRDPRVDRRRHLGGALDVDARHARRRGQRRRPATPA